MDAAIHSRLLTLAEEHELEKDIRDAAERRCDEIKSEIGYLMTEEGLAKTDVEGFPISVISVPRDSLSKEALLLSGVSTDQILGATKTTYSTQVRVGKRKVAA